MADDFATNSDTQVVHLRWWGSYMGAEHFKGSGVKSFYIGFESDVPATDATPSHPGVPLLQQWVAKGLAAPASGTFTESLIQGPDPVLGEARYEYNAEFKCPFPQHRDTVYWLTIAAMVDPSTEGSIQWGWHNRDYTMNDPLASPLVTPGEKLVGFAPGSFPVRHFQGDAIAGTLITTFLDQCSGSTGQTDLTPNNYLDGIDGPSGIGAFSKDLAFEVYTGALPEPGTMALAGIGIAMLSIRRRR